MRSVEWITTKTESEQMRIISGKYGGRIIKAPDGDNTRPTTDRIREAMLSSLISYAGSLDGCNVLDLFAGSGALGIECLSRGADRCTFCDRSKSAIFVLKENLANLKIADDEAWVIRSDVLKSGIPATNAPYDLILLDPPYRFSAKDVLALIASGMDEGKIASNATIMYEYGSSSIDDVLSTQASLGFKVLSHKKYTTTCVDIMCIPYID